MLAGSPILLSALERASASRRFAFKRVALIHGRYRLDRKPAAQSRPGRRVGCATPASGSLTLAAAARRAGHFRRRDRVAGHRRDAVDQKVRVLVPDLRRLESGDREIRRAGLDLRHAHHLGLAMLIAVPVGIGIAIFLTEICPRRSAPARSASPSNFSPASPASSTASGACSFSRPGSSRHVEPWSIDTFGDMSRSSRTSLRGPPYGIGIFTASLILSIMILPFISAVTRDVFETVPPMLKEAAYGLGCTTWEVMWRVVLPFARAGVVGGAMLALGRALGETMAVTFVIGNAHHIQKSVFAPGTTISATIANEFTEATSAIFTCPSLIETGPDPVLHHLHRAGERAADAARAGAPRGRRRHEQQASTARRKTRQRDSSCTLSVLRGGLRPGLARLHPGRLVLQRLRGDQRQALHRDDAAARRGWRPAQRHRRQPDDEHDRRGGRHADRPARRHLSRRIWPPHAARLHRALCQRHPAQRAVDRHRPLHLRDRRASRWGISRAGPAPLR